MMFWALPYTFNQIYQTKLLVVRISRLPTLRLEGKSLINLFVVQVCDWDIYMRLTSDFGWYDHFLIVWVIIFSLPKYMCQLSINVMVSALACTVLTFSPAGLRSVFLPWNPAIKSNGVLNYKSMFKPHRNLLPHLPNRNCDRVTALERTLRGF